jgi:pimeloyl-ACP methyl ester carboxylesterase
MQTTLSGVANNGSAYDLYGAADAPVIVLIHGLGLCRHLWADYLAALSDKYRVLNYDLYGHGDSLPSPEKASLAVYSEQLAQLMDELAISQAAIIGFSIGGMINRRFAIDHPNKVTALVILNSPHERGSKAQQLVEERATNVAKQGVLSTMEAALVRWFTAEFHLSHPQVLQQVLNWRLLADPSSYAQAAWVLAAGVTELCQDRIAVDAPALVLSCENDTGSTPAMSHGIAAQIDHAEIQIIPKLQHLGLLEQPKLFTQTILAFLAKAKL